MVIATTYIHRLLSTPTLPKYTVGSVPGHCLHVRVACFLCVFLFCFFVVVFLFVFFCVCVFCFLFFFFGGGVLLLLLFFSFAKRPDRHDF